MTDSAAKDALPPLPEAGYLATAYRTEEDILGYTADDMRAYASAAIAALAGGQAAVAWEVRFTDEGGLRSLLTYGKNAHELPQCKGREYTVRALYATHPAPMLGALREIFDAFSGDVDQVGDPVWVLDDADYQRFAALIAATKEAP